MKKQFEGFKSRLQHRSKKRKKERENERGREGK